MADHRRGGGGYADHKRGGFSDSRSNPYQRPRGRGTLPSRGGGSGGGQEGGSSDFGAAFRRPPTASSGSGGFGEAFNNRQTSSGSGDFGSAFRRPPTASGFGEAFNRQPSSGNGGGFGEAFHRPPAPSRYGPPIPRVNNGSQQQQQYGSRGPRPRFGSGSGPGSGYGSGSGYGGQRSNGPQSMTLGCNFIRLDLLDPNRMIWEYEVIFEPEVSDRLRRSRLVGRHFYTVTNSSLKVYDTGAMLWSPIKTENDTTEGTYDLKDGQQIKVTLKKKTQRNISECRIILNVIVKRIMTETQMVKIKRSHFNPDLTHISPEHKVEVWPGFVTAVDEFDGGVLLNIDVSFKVLQNTSVFDVLSELIKSGDVNAFRERANSMLLGTSVITRYNNKIIRIDEIDFESNPLSTFERKGEKITYLEYYKTQYNIVITDHFQPLLINRVKKRPTDKQKDGEEILNKFVPELCHLTSLSDAQRGNFKLMKHLASITQLNPTNRNRDITRFLQSVNENANCKKLLADWGLRLPNQSIEMEGRTLAPEVLKFGNNRTSQENNADWGRSLARQQVLNAIPLDNWAIVFTARDERTVGGFIQKLIQAGERIGIRASRPAYQVQINSDRADEYMRPVQKLTNVQLIMVIFPTRRDDRYVTIKRLCHDMNVPSQVINAKTISNPGKLEGVCTKVIMQINCKLGGSLWGVNLPHEQEGLMICGLDMSHDSGRLRPANSTVALVASVDKTATRYTSSCVMVPPGASLIDKMAELFVPCLNQWFQMNGHYPKYIVVYRVGIDDGRVRVVKDVEIGRLRNAFSAMQPDYCPFITYVVVQSRNNTRLYSKRPDGSMDNPPPGTVLDHTVTRKNLEDFYLISPSTRQGTVAPTHYVIVENTSDMTLQEIESLTFKQSHMYYNWSATIRVPAPCQYASRLAQQVAQRINPPTSDSMKSTLFFL